MVLPLEKKEVFMKENEKKISRRESAALVNAITGGVVSRVGLRHIAVGRHGEINALLGDLSTVEAGGGSFRVIAGQYGSGKSFLLQMIRNYAMERNFVTFDGDLSPERRLLGAKKEGLATYRELVQNCATQTRPDGGALESILQKWISVTQIKVAKVHQLAPNDPNLVPAVSREIQVDMMELSEMSYGFAFTSVLDAYWRGMKTGDDLLKQESLRWLRGEFSTKTEAKKVLGVDSIIDDQNWYEFTKLFARFVVKAGYLGLLMFIDEGVNLYKINHRISRESNYEKVLTMFNDTMQGKAKHFGIFFSGTMQFLTDERRGLYSYEALRSRLVTHAYQKEGLVDYTSPVIQLHTLKNEELYLLLERLSQLHSTHFNWESPLKQEELTAFLQASLEQVGAESRLTPREFSRNFMGLLSMLQQNPDKNFDFFVENKEIYLKSEEKDPEWLNEGEVDEFAEFEL